MNVNKSSWTQMILTQLEEFRQAIYDCLGKARDAVFDLMDAVLTSPSIQSFVSLSQNERVSARVAECLCRTA
jgi:hypothetical protein